MSETDRESGPADPLAEARHGRALTVTAAAAHDLRSAVSTVAAAADLLAASGLNERQHAYVTTMRHVADDMLALLRDILEAERREAAEPSIEPQPIDFTAFLDRVAAALRVRTAAKGLACAFDRAPGLPHRIVADPVRLGQIVSNLIDNAIKVTEAGMVRVGVEAEPDADAFRLVLRVEDEGPGLDSERVFEPYVQGADGVLRGGLGLGLAIVKTLAERMGGGVRAEPRARGTAFVVRVRCGLAPNPGEIREPKPVPSRCACLVVDDDPASRALAAALLRGLGHGAMEAGSAEEALRLLEAHVFDVAFVDPGVAPVGGIELARRIRGLGERGRLPLVALTADANSTQALRAGGFAAHVAKPVTAAALAEAVARAVAAGDAEIRKRA